MLQREEIIAQYPQQQNSNETSSLDRCAYLVHYSQFLPHLL